MGKNDSRQAKEVIPDFASEVAALAKGLIVKVVDIAKLVYQIIAPLVSSLLEKSATFICEKQPQLDKHQVKKVLAIILALLVLWIIF